MALFTVVQTDSQLSLRDTLQRHSTIHGQLPTKVHKTLPRAAHACINCIKSKQRCSGFHPCDRCNRKNWHCQFTKGSRQVAAQREEILMRAASERTSNQSNQNQGQNDVSEPSHTSWVSPTSGVDSLDLRIPSRANSTGEPCAGPAFPNQTRHTPQESEMTSIFESFLLWPLDDASEHYNISSINPSGTSAPSGIARTLNPSTNVSLGAEAAMTLAPFQQRTSRHATLPVSPGSSSTQTGYRVTEDAITEEDRDILISEDYGHVPRPSTSVYEEICAFHAEVSWCSPDGPLPRLYTLEILHVCTQLYFEHFHRSFPVLHQGTFEVRSESWLLYLAVAAVGSQYSRLSIRTKLFSNLVTIIRESLLRKVDLI